jgi:hypothetical protein
MTWFKRKKKPTYSYHPNPIGRVELAKRDIYIMQLEEEIAHLRRVIAGELTRDTEHYE